MFVFVFMIGACLSQGRAQTKSAVSYKNPVVDIAMPDPTVIKAADGYFLCVCYRIYQKRSDHEVERFGGMDVLQHCIHE